MARVQVARNQQGNIRLADESQKGEGPFSCVECKSGMVFKLGGSPVLCFAHLANTNTEHLGHGHGETSEHSYAKRLISSNIKNWSFVDKCGECSGNIRTHRFTDAKEDACADFRLDVAATDKAGSVAAIEVYQTHRIGQDKRDSLEASGLIVIEVEARQVIAAFKNGTFTVTNCPRFPPCDECVYYKKKAAAYQMEQNEHKSKKARLEMERAVIHAGQMEEQRQISSVWYDLAEEHYIEEQQAETEWRAALHLVAKQALEARLSGNSTDEAPEEERRANHQLAKKEQLHAINLAAPLALEANFFEAYGMNRIYLAIPQYRKYEALAIMPRGIHWDETADWDNPAVAPCQLLMQRTYKRNVGSYWATVTDAMKMLPFWRQEYIRFANTILIS